MSKKPPGKSRKRALPVTGLSWERLEEQLAASGGRSARGSEFPLEEILDAQELPKLRRLARSARRLRARMPVLGNVVFLHGITGSDLCSVDRSGDRSDVWVSVPGLIVGRIERLQLNANGSREFLSSYRVEPSGVNQRYYAQAVLTLRARWNVLPFAYDWRKDMDLAADDLAAFIRTRFPGQPVHLVAHSMGGLVARNFIRRHRALWKSMAEPDHKAGGRLIMLGTPNYGSFAIPQVLSGTDTLMNWLALIDLRHNLQELLAITNSFVGTYQLLPAPSKLSPTLQSIYQRDTWGSIAGISQAHLKRAFDFHFDLEQGNTVDPLRMIYIAGCRHATPSGCTIAARGDFDYLQTDDGDGRVTHALGMLKDVPTYFVDEAHGDLARNEAVLAGVDEALQSGRTSNLVTTVLRGVARGAGSALGRRTALERRYGDDIRRASARLRSSDKPEAALDKEDQRLITEAIMAAATGAAPAATRKKPSIPSITTLTAATQRQQARLPLRVRLRWGDITTVRTPMIVVGHYRGVPPVNAIGAVDRKLDGWITMAVRQGMIAGSLGETFLIPSRGRLPAEAITVAGMGDAGEFNLESLRTLMANVAIGAAGFGLQKVTTLLVGWGEGNLDADSALRGQLEGIGLGLQQFRDEQGRPPTLRELELVELKAHKFLELHERIQDLSRADSLSDVQLQFTAPSSRVIAQAERWRAQLNRSTARQGRGGAQRANSPAGNTLPDVRLAVERVSGDPGLFRFAALTQKAVVPVREVRVNSRYVDGTAEALRGAARRDEQVKFGRLLYSYLMPEDFQDLIDGDAPIRLIVDASTAGLPWEMACYSSRRARRSLRWLGLDQQLSRQFRTLLSQPPGIVPPLSDRVRVLVIGDPAPEPELRLPGARAEARRIVRCLSDRSLVADLQVDVESRIGPGECDPVEILALLATEDYDIIHYCGHGDYDAQAPLAAGWVFGRNQLITAVDIFRTRRVPRLVFANACFSGVLHASEGLVPAELSRATATIAQAFFERGVRNFIGTGWPVDDEAAALLAEKFYGAVFQRQSIGAALLTARRAVFDQEGDSTWGAYQHYGDPAECVLPDMKDD